MIAKILVSLGLVLYSTTFAQHNGSEVQCSARDAKIVQKEWNSLWKRGDSRMKIMMVKMNILLTVESHPEAKELFEGVRIDDHNSGEFEAHCLRIFNYFDLLVSLLHDRKTLHKASEHLGHQHAARPGVLGTYFMTLKSILMSDLALAIDGFHNFSWDACLVTMLQGVITAIPQ